MSRIESSVSPKGQVTIPRDVRVRWGIQAKDRVVFVIEDGEVRLEPLRMSIMDSYGAIPPLREPLSDNEQTHIAAEEHADRAAAQDRTA